MSHIAGDICARSRTCSGVSVIERLPFLWPDALAVLRLLGLRVLINAQRSIRPKNALWTIRLCKSDAGCGGSCAHVCEHDPDLLARRTEGTVMRGTLQGAG